MSETVIKDDGTIIEDVSSREIRLETKDGEKTFIQYVNGYGFQVALKDPDTMRDITDKDLYATMPKETGDGDKDDNKEGKP